MKIPLKTRGFLINMAKAKKENTKVKEEPKSEEWETQAEYLKLKGVKK